MPIDFKHLELCDTPQTVIIPSQEAYYILDKFRDSNIFFKAVELEPETPDEFKQVADTLSHYYQFNIYSLLGIEITSPVSQEIMDSIVANLPYDDDYIDYRLSNTDNRSIQARQTL